MNILIFISAVLLAVVLAKVGQECTINYECGVDECCQVLSEFMVASKRANLGTCQKYVPEGQPCGVYDKINGYCSCYPGYTCLALEVPIKDNTVVGVQKRRPPPPREGYTYNVTCVKDAA